MTTLANVIPAEERISLRAIPFALMHVAALGWLWTGTNPIDWVVCAALFWSRMFGITAGYHRYFAHRSYRTSRPFAFVLALLGAASAQKGVLWWAGCHRHHHRYSDQPEDIHSPVQRGFWWSHVHWILCTKWDRTPTELIKDFARYPELRFLDRHHLLVPVLTGTLVWWFLGWSGLWAGFFLSTVLLYHATFTVNSLNHVIGKKRFDTPDESRNHLGLALLTMGEGWHNNHHHYQASCRQGFYWWEVDATWWILRGLARLGIVWDLISPPERVLRARRLDEEPDLASPELTGKPDPQPAAGV